MNNKYYTPEIEELHVGFECEVFYPREEKWKQRKIRNGEDLCEIVTRYEQNKESVRVKDQKC